jgi:cytoskeletal protein CcmA (bactofilin family)
MGSLSRGWKRLTTEDLSAAAAEPGGDAPPPPQTTRIEPGCEVDGTLKLEGPLTIEGEFRGAIDCGDDVTVRASGTVEAAIRARSLIIEGAVVGDVSATREVVITATGRLHGDVETPCLAVERGAFFQGQTRMYRPEVVARRRATDDDAPGLTRPVPTTP